MADGREIRRVLAGTSSARRRLSFAEVVQAGAPAAYSYFGERLVFIDGRLLDARRPEAVVEISMEGPAGVGEVICIEFGWRHTAACSCRLCAESASA